MSVSTLMQSTLLCYFKILRRKNKIKTFKVDMYEVAQTCNEKRFLLRKRVCKKRNRTQGLRKHLKKRSIHALGGGDDIFIKIKSCCPKKKKMLSKITITFW